MSIVDTISLDRNIEMNHFISQARGWLEQSEEGKHSVAISYAAFEIRLAVERICMQYYVKLIGAKEAKASSNELGSFKKMKAKIFSVAGHQKEINKQFEFTRCLLKALNINAVVPTPDLGRLSAIWHDCSEACHIFWNVAEATEYERGEYKPYTDLVAYADELEQIANSTVAWLNSITPQMRVLMDKLEGMEDCEKLIRKHFSKEGLWAKFEPADGSPGYLIGDPIIGQEKSE